jgi:hypothetical protein
MPVPLTGAALAAIAPELAKRGLDLLSGVFRGAVDQGADKVSELIKEKTGIDVHDVAENKLTDEQWVKLKQFELAHQDELLAFRQGIEAGELEMEKLRVEDTKSAREAQAKRDANDDSFVRRFTYYYAFLITGLTFAFIFAAILIPMYVGEDKIPDNSWRIIDTVLGFLLGIGLSAIIQFYFGSSSGSQSKSDQLSKLTERFSLSQAEASRSAKEGGR